MGLWELGRSYGWSPQDWDLCPIKETAEVSLVPFILLRHRGKSAIFEPESRSLSDTESPDALTLEFQSLEL